MMKNKTREPIIGQYGKHTKTAVMILGYGSSIRQATKQTGMGIRRIKTLIKHLRKGKFESPRWRKAQPFKVRQVSPTGRHHVWEPQIHNIKVQGIHKPLSPDALKLIKVFTTPGVCTV